MHPFGNAIGNSIVTRLSSPSGSQLSAKGEKAYEEAIAANKSQTVAQQEAIEAMVAELPAEKRNQLTISETEKEIRIGLSEKSNGVNLAKQVNRIDQLREQHVGLLGWMNDNKLMGSEPLLNMSLSMFNGRSSYYSLDNIRQNGNEAFERGIVEGIHKVRQATAQRNANFTGFRGDLMTQEDWGRTISAHTQKWAQQDASDVVTLISIAAMAPMLAADLLVVGALAGRGALTLGRGLMNGADDMGRSLYSSIQANGIRGTVLNVGSQRVSWATVESANLAAMRQMVHQPAVLTTDAALNAATAFSWRTQYGGGLHLLKTAAANPNIRAGFVSGLANTSVDYYINGSNANISASFIGGFVGGSLGSYAAQNLTSTIRPVVSGLVGGAVGEFWDQQLRGEDFNLPDIGLSAATGVLATVGVNKLFKVNTTVTVTPPNPAHSTSAAMSGGFVGSYSNGYFSNWFDQWFR